MGDPRAAEVVGGSARNLGEVSPQWPVRVQLCADQQIDVTFLEPNERRLHIKPLEEIGVRGRGSTHGQGG